MHSMYLNQKSVQWSFVADFQSLICDGSSSGKTFMSIRAKNHGDVYLTW